MYLSISKRFDFESSHRLAVKGFSDKQNVAVYGREGSSRHGHGHNYSCYFIFDGPVDEATGMLVNVAVIKDRIKTIIDSRYDHRFLNDDTPPFGVVVPTAENVASRLLEDVRPLFADLSATPVVCHLVESSTSEATAYCRGTVEKHLWTDFSAARRTYSPHLSDAENEKMFGLAASPSGHGHHYRLRVTLGGNVDREHGMVFPTAEAQAVLDELHDRLDHRNFSVDIDDFKKMPMTTEMLARFFYHHLKNNLPVSRIRLFENDRFFAEYSGGDMAWMAVSADFFAAHRLHSTSFSDEENLSVFGKCNNPGGHGHQYGVECTIEGHLDERSGTIHKLGELERDVDRAVDQWNYKHLNMDTDDFRDRVTTGENIVRVLWSRVEKSLGNRLCRLRLWETRNNRFTLRRTVQPR